MIVYGDQERTETARSRLQVIRASLARWARLPPGLRRHDALTRAFIEAAELAQGVDDAVSARLGHDDDTPIQATVRNMLVALARELCLSWSSGYTRAPCVPHGQLDAVSIAALPRTVTLRAAEGYAFYTLYPESYFAAAAAMQWPKPPVVIGIRSIGTGLGAVVAVASGARRFVTVRPRGHPFARSLALSPRLRAALADRAAVYAVVDEGPGLSGSSFGTVADLLEDNGIPPSQVTFFPGHAGALGPHASERHRTRWSAARRPVVAFQALSSGDIQPADRFDGWFADLAGASTAPPEDISGGRWRRGPTLPPVDAPMERRKFILRTKTGDWLVKFAGLGRIGEEKLDRALALYRAGHVAQPLGVRRGFLVERFHREGRPLGTGDMDREALIRRLADYLGFRASTFPAAPRSGADIGALASMAIHNVTALLGDPEGSRLERRLAGAAALESRARRVHTDNRLQAWEWIWGAGNRLMKTDAVDHSAAHDLIGCQDIAWDIAGATVEHDLTRHETAMLAARVAGATGRPIDSDLLEVFSACYPAFQGGYWALAYQRAAADERSRIASLEGKYLDRLRRLLRRD